MADLNTTVLSKALDGFAKEIKITDSVYEQIRGRRETVVKYIETYLNSKGIKITEQFNIGSYITKTGVSYHDNDFDIDYALVVDTEGFIKHRENLIIWLRDVLKDKYKMPVRVEDSKNVIGIKFYNDNNAENEKKALFHLDIPFYIDKSGTYYHFKKQYKGGPIVQVASEPKLTNDRQKSELDESKGQNSKRNAILILKYLMSRKHLSGISSIYITDRVISLSRALDTYSLIVEFLRQAEVDIVFLLEEMPKTNLIDAWPNLNSTAKTLKSNFIKETTYDTYTSINRKLNNKLPEISKEELADNSIERHFGG